MKKFTKFAISVILISNTSFHADTLNFESLENRISMYPVEMQQEIRNRLNQNSVRSNVQGNYSYQQQTRQNFNQNWGQNDNNEQFNHQRPHGNPEFEEFLNSNPELKSKMEEIRHLSPDDRHAAMQELEAQYPELAQMRPPRGQEGQGGRQSPQMQEFFQNNPELKSKMEEIRNLSPEDRHTAMQELEAQYPELAQMKPKRGQKRQQNPQMQELFDSNPTLKSEITNIKNLSAEERYTAIKQIQEKYPELQQVNRNRSNSNNNQSSMSQRQRGQGANPQMDQFFQSNPDLKSKMDELRQLSPQERHTAMQELKSQYPELQQMRPNRRGGNRQGRGQRGSQNSRSNF